MDIILTNWKQRLPTRVWNRRSQKKLMKIVILEKFRDGELSLVIHRYIVLYFSLPQTPTANRIKVWCSTGSLALITPSSLVSCFVTNSRRHGRHIFLKNNCSRQKTVSLIRTYRKNFTIILESPRIPSLLFTKKKILSKFRKLNTSGHYMVSQIMEYHCA